MNQVTKSAVEALLGPAGPKKKKQPAPGMPGYVAPLAAVGGLGTGLAYGMGSDSQADLISKTIARHGTPLEPNETLLSRYSDMMSAGASSTPFGKPIGEYLAYARSSPAVLRMAGADPAYAASSPGSYQEARMHYDQFRKGPISAYSHMIHPRAGMSVPKYNVDGKSYPEFIKPHFEKSWLKFVNDHPNLRGAAGWLEPHEIDLDVIPFEDQRKFLKNFHQSLPPEVKTIKEKFESDMEPGGRGASLENNLKNYLPINRAGVKARNTLKTVGFTAGGAAAGGLLGAKIYDWLNRKNNKEPGIGRTLSGLAGAGLGGGLGYLVSSPELQSRIGKLIGSAIASKSAALPKDVTTCLLLPR